MASERGSHVPGFDPASGDRFTSSRLTCRASVSRICRHEPNLNTPSTTSPDASTIYRSRGFQPLRALRVRLRRPNGFRLAMWHPNGLPRSFLRTVMLIKRTKRRLEPHPRILGNPSAANRNALRTFLAPETTRWQYTRVCPIRMRSPDGMSLDNSISPVRARNEVQLDLFGDYKSNVSLYPAFQEYFRTHKPPLLAVWATRSVFSTRWGQRI